MRRRTRPMFMAGASLGACLVLLNLTGCSSNEEEGASRIPPPPSAIVYDGTAFDDFVDGPMKHYLQATDALAHDRFVEAQGAFVAMAAVSDAELQALVRVAAGASDLASVRVALNGLSAAVQKLPLPAGMALAYCPMVFDYEGGHWIQRDGPIMNPYFGASMLHCGVFEEENL
jgi:hypothetical protein